jgi:hypothetical protein
LPDVSVSWRKSKGRLGVLVSGCSDAASANGLLCALPGAAGAGILAGGAGAAWSAKGAKGSGVMPALVNTEGTSESGRPSSSPWPHCAGSGPSASSPACTLKSNSYVSSSKPGPGRGTTTGLPEKRKAGRSPSPAMIAATRAEASAAAASGAESPARPARDDGLSAATLEVPRAEACTALAWLAGGGATMGRGGWGWPGKSTDQRS